MQRVEIASSPRSGLCFLFMPTQCIQSYRLYLCSTSHAGLPGRRLNGNILHLDHAPIHCDLRLPHLPTRSFNWRLNENLLSDALCLSELQSTVKSFTEIPSNDPTSKPMQWEALKCVLRGVLIKHGSRLKKEASAKLKNLLAELHDLESAHKSAQSDQVLRELTRVGKRA